MPRASDVIVGLPQFERALAEWSDDLKQALREVVKESAQELRDDERADVPVDTGALRDGIDIDYSNEGLLAEVGQSDPDRTHIAEFVENGTSSMPARPYAAPAAERQRARMAGRVAARVRGITR